LGLFWGWTLRNYIFSIVLAYFPVQDGSFSLPFLIFPGYLQVPGARGEIPSWQRFHHLKTIPICSMMLVYLLVGALEHEFDFREFHHPN